MNETIRNDSRRMNLLTALLILLAWGFRFIPLVVPEGRLWGFNQLLYLPAGYVVLFIVGGMAALALTVPRWGGKVLRLYDAVAGMLFETPARRRWLIAAAAAVVVFWIGRLPIFLLGDSYSVAANISNELPVIYKWSEIGTIYAAFFISKLLPVTGSQLGEYAYGIVSVLSGGVTVFLFLAIASACTADNAGRLLIFCLLLFAGWVVLFQGYTENYPILWPFLTAYIYFAVRYINNKSSLLWPTVFLLLGLVMHLQTLFFVLSYPIMLIARGELGRWYRRHRKPVHVGAVVLSLAGIAVFAWLYQSSLELRLYVVPFLHGHPATPYYSLVSPTHFLDMANLFLLLSPLLPMLILLGWRRESIFADKTNLFFFWMSIGGLIFLLMIDPKLGMARDWDLFALVGLPPTLLFARMLAAQERIRKWLYPALVLTAAVLVMPFVAVNASRQPALNQYQALLRLDLPKSRTGLTILYSIYKAAGDSALADSVEQVLVTAIPAARQAPLAHQLAEEGKFEQALILVDSMARVEPYSVETLNLRGLVYLKMGQYSRAVQDLELAGRLGRYDSRPLTSLASAYSALHQFDRMMDALRQAQKRDPDAFHVLSGLAVGFFDLRQFDSAKVYAMRAIQIQPTYETGYFIIGYIAHMAGDKTTAKIYLTRVVDLAPGSTYGKRAAELLAQLP